jgi:hypothetical protein
MLEFKVGVAGELSLKLRSGVATLDMVNFADFDSQTNRFDRFRLARFCSTTLDSELRVQHDEPRKSGILNHVEQFELP